jgi:hypothetical protein
MSDAGGVALARLSMVRDTSKAARTEEDVMYPYIARALADERVKELRNEAVWAQRSRLLRHPGRGRTAQAQQAQVPDTYEDFLCLTAGSVLRERSGQAGGQTVR